MSRCTASTCSPVTWRLSPGHDNGYDRDLPGLYPDLLRPLPDATIAPMLGSWRGLWVDFRVDEPAAAGLHEVDITISDARSRVLYRHTMRIEVIGSGLPPLPIANTHWFHCDGLAQFYGVEVFSEQHWQLIDAFLGSASRMQVNMILTPVWTPPLDTETGGHRLTTQLLRITHRKGRYSVDFTLLDRWLELCRKHGIERLEIAHLFTQWGAHATPSIYVTRAGESVEEFGWHVSATDPKYRRFLEQVLPVLKTHLAQHWGLERVLFHLSDEPNGRGQLSSYLQAKAIVEDLLAPCTVIDALSDAEFYDTGAVPHPVVATDAIAPFLARGVRRLWVYYCVNQDRGVSNRFFAMPSSRNRVIGHQLFAYDCAGFLNWGFNFYNSELSRRPINPFQDTTASLMYRAQFEHVWQCAVGRALAAGGDMRSNPVRCPTSWRAPTLATVVGLALLTAACGGGGSSSTGSDQTKGVTIAVALAADPPPAADLAAFTKQSGITVNWVNIDWDSLQTKISTAATAKTYFADATDVDWSRVGQLGKLGWFSPMEKYTDTGPLKADMPQLTSFTSGALDGRQHRSTKPPCVSGCSECVHFDFAVSR